MDNTSIIMAIILNRREVNKRVVLIELNHLIDVSRHDETRDAELILNIGNTLETEVFCA